MGWVLTPITGATRSERSLPRIGWIILLAVGVGLIGAVNLYLAGRSIRLVSGGAPAVDWDQIVEASRRIVAGGDVYEVTNEYSFPYSPLLAYAAGALSWLGTAGWRLLHVAAAFALPTWPMRILCLVSWPFWFDVETGNLLVFVVLAAAWAIRGNGVATSAYLTLLLLIPRPLMLPVAAWLLWKRPAWRLPFLALAVLSIGAIILSGWGDDWARFLISISSQFDSPNNLGPTRLIGAAWLLVAVPLAGYLTWRGQLGLASVTISYPYVLPYYLLVLLLDVPRRLSHGWAWRTP